jgi:hypothetical protein
MDDRNEADRILGEDWMEPRHVRLVKALEAHPECELIEELRETDASGERPLVALPPTLGRRLGRGLAPPAAARAGRGAGSDQGRSMAREEAELDPLARAHAITASRTTRFTRKSRSSSYSRPMEGRRIDEVRIELRRGIVSIPWSSRDALLEQLQNRDSMNNVREVRDAFLAAGTTRPVQLTDPQKLGLRNVITFWANEMGGSYDDLPEGIHALRNALQDDLRVVGVPEDAEQDPAP